MLVIPSVANAVSAVEGLPPAQAIVQRAYDRIRSYGAPPYVVYLANENGDIYRIAFRASDEKMNQSEYNPKRSGLPLAVIYTAFVGPLSITVHEAIAKTAATPVPSAGATQEQSSLVSDLKTIAVVSANARPIYKAAVRDVETVDNRSTYKIELSPAADPTRYTLRDLWIDTTTNDVVRADYITRDTNVPEATVYLTVEFEPVGPYWIAAHWIAIYHFLGAQPPVYRELRIDKARFPDALPDWLFDQQGYELHSLAGDADPLAHLFDGQPTP
jgi:hypothetical protein